MTTEPNDAERLTVVIYAPTGRDAELAHGVLTRAGIRVGGVSSMAELCASIERGVGAVVLVEESLRGRDGELLSSTLAQQAAWSDLPLIIVAARTVGESPRRFDALMHLGNVTIIERPTRIRLLVNAVQAALRTRRRQYDAEREITQRDTFLAMLGHELRNPLAAIVLSSNYLLADEEAHPKLHRHHATIDRQARHLQRLVDDLLEVARVTTGKANIKAETVDVAIILERCVQRLARGDERVTFKRPAFPVWVRGDEVRLEQIFGNLVTNALKYTPVPKPITVSLAVATGECIASVRDEGIGIAPSMLPRVFELFAQADGAIARSDGGMGVGLTLVRDLVARHGGHVEASSLGLGHGTTFTVRLPIVPPPREEVSSAAPAARVQQRRRVVIVEDNEDLREIMQATLERAGHDVRSAGDGESGLSLILELQPDVALLDLGLPGLDGYQVAKRVRSALDGTMTTLIAVSGYGQPSDKRASLAAGFDLHLTKPIDAKTLLKAMAVKADELQAG